ncbi:MAG: glycosyltransferase family 1 protein [Butyrivibrio sp.]|uniref:glycosyltransferase family protein n=1 Tax=Butyrivibrio sp. TaxID=28121 RepID=UPI001B1371D0|nr:glycosyltransferase [Butyrivibrio sp.]MBO6241713.1 glycosyltransferase family 1 protein [Butyrivibrio sp.]
MSNEKVLIYKGSDVCYNILDHMAEQLGNAFIYMGFSVTYYDIEKGLSSITDLIGEKYVAIIGFQTKIFEIYLQSKNCYLHDLIEGPKFNFCFDHPIWLSRQLKNVPLNYYVLTHDRNYAEFIGKYYRNIAGVYLLPPGGTESENSAEEKKQDIIFMGTYENYRNIFPVIRKSDKALKHLACSFLCKLKHNINKTAEENLKMVLDEEKIEYDDEKFIEVLDSLKIIVKCIAYYYREKVIRTLLESDIDVTVYGNSWESSPFYGNEHLLIKPAVTPKESLYEYSISKLSLNIMLWHKDGFTERIANSMLNRSVVVSDMSTCLKEQYSNGEEIILFKLDNISGLPARLKELLKDEDKRKMIADKAYQRAQNEDTWGQRARLLLDYISEENYAT